jgi:hypothetical protein
MLPLSLRADQDTLICLVDFFSYSSTENIVEPVSNTRRVHRPYFQNVSIDEIKLKIDYKPKHLDFQGLRNGNFIEFMNILMLTDSHLTCTPISLSGVFLHRLIPDIRLGQSFRINPKHMAPKPKNTSSKPSIRPNRNLLPSKYNRRSIRPHPSTYFPSPSTRRSSHARSPTRRNVIYKDCGT